MIRINLQVTKVMSRYWDILVWRNDLIYMETQNSSPSWVAVSVYFVMSETQIKRLNRRLERERQGMDHDNLNWHHAYVFLRLPFILRFRGRVDGDVSFIRIAIFTGDINSCIYMGRTCLKINPTEKKAELRPRKYWEHSWRAWIWPESHATPWLWLQKAIKSHFLLS